MPELTIAIPMPTVTILMALSIVHAKMVSGEMERTVKVSFEYDAILGIHFLLVNNCKIHIWCVQVFSPDLNGDINND